MSIKKQRFLIDPNIHLTDFASLFLVQCPRCQGCARVIPELDTTREFVNPYFPERVKFLCPRCGAVKEKGKCLRMWVGGPCDWYFRLPLYLQMPCCGHILWAHNLEHLQYLEQYVQAELRERSTIKNQRYTYTSTYERTLATRLPKWMKSAKNRAEVIKCIHKLQHLLLQ
ncbi:hypothetical protein [Dictyobacter kobayashii]|uniref:Uncharacterized protein n=1 Tax=Dictyobacter kobayashii TaxID=2014872 RepID=A0A402AR43_9CHLR|nr:hypothetical protein [Dictyobacter kobayashii]GCE21543.1 hypothetical protein KDK_53430 [Dictyobacter kobayashii]